MSNKIVNNHQKTKFNLTPWQNKTSLAITSLGLTGLVLGCNTVATQIDQVSASQTDPSPTNTSTITPLPTSTTIPSPTSSPTITPSPTPWPTATLLPTSTPWPTPVLWQPESFSPPTLEPIPIIPTSTALPTVQQFAAPGGVVAVGYSPPDGVDVFGNTILRWVFNGQLAPDEWFDIKIKPVGSHNSAFVDWTKNPEYDLRAWSGWSAGLYTWQIGIVKGHKEGDTKHFIADTGRDSAPLLIKWQAAGGDNDGGGGGSNNNGGGSGGGGNSGGS